MGVWAEDSRWRISEGDKIGQDEWAEEGEARNGIYLGRKQRRREQKRHGRRYRTTLARYSRPREETSKATELWWGITPSPGSSGFVVFKTFYCKEGNIRQCIYFSPLQPNPHRGMKITSATLVGYDIYFSIDSYVKSSTALYNSDALMALKAILPWKAFHQQLGPQSVAIKGQVTE